MSSNGSLVNTAEARTRLLSRAAEFTSELGDILDQLGNTLLPAAGEVDDPSSTARSKASQLEHLLSTRLQSLGAKRNLALSPISRLNDDLLRTIFLIPSNARDSILTRRYFALAVSAVCKRWQEVALSTAPLWACLRFAGSRPLRSLHFVSTPPEQLASIFDEVQREMRAERLFLDRAKGAPLTVELDLSRASADPTFNRDPVLYHIPKDFTSFADRIEDLTLTAIPYMLENLHDLFTQSLSLVRGKVKRLQLSLRASIRMPFPFDFFSEPLPNLENLVLNMLPLLGRNQVAVMSTVRHLEVRTSFSLLDASGLRALLASTPQLVSLRIHTQLMFGLDTGAEVGDGQEQSHNMRVRLPYLHTLYWEVWEWSRVPLAMLEAPALSALTLMVVKDIGHVPLPVFNDTVFNESVQTFLGSTSPVRELAVRGIPAQCILQMLPQLPLVSRLTLRDAPPYLARVRPAPHSAALLAAMPNLAALGQPHTEPPPGEEAPQWYDDVLHVLRGLCSGSAEREESPHAQNNQQHALLPKLEDLDIWVTEEPMLEELVALTSDRIQSPWLSRVHSVRLGFSQSPRIGSGQEIPKWLMTDENASKVRQLAARVDTLDTWRSRFDSERSEWVSKWAPS
ncbi:hypothetical protein CALVIDRAFT_537011 [Calocera viscosa TUFC12733]|uniref:F-box domain-containing protein n=1 Tax=Calocera viscosa (strain TUFC12733) TaxID=1330018 RepID=A0A167MF08_CALVF|nr:hypothetical protein CALVIDRAFT_537011 [Calocera viscosa TUFC12733]